MKVKWTKVTAGNKNPEGVDGDMRTVVRSLPLYLSIGAGILVFIVYLMTLSPGVSWAHHSEDSGDLITSAWILGIPHSTGYPLFTMLGWLWSHALPIGTVAFRMNMFSAFWSAMSVVVTVRAVWASFGLYPVETVNKVGLTGRAISSVSAALLLGFAANVWSLSVVTEVYSFNLFFTVLITWILIELLKLSRQPDVDSSPKKSPDKKKTRLLSLLGLVWGLSLCNHLMSAFLAPGILLVIFASGLRPKLTDILRSAVFFVIGLLPYMYLLLRSMMNPVLDWGNPETIGNLSWVVSGRQFRQLMFTMLPQQSLHQIFRYYSVPYELGAIGALVSFIGICTLFLARNRQVILLLVHTLLLVTATLFYLGSYYIWDPEGYLLPMIFAVVIWAGMSASLIGKIDEKILIPVKLIMLLILVAAPVWSVFSHYDDVDLSSNREAVLYGEETFEILEEDALVLEVRYERAFTLWYYRYVEYADTRDDVEIIFLEHATFEWGLNQFRDRMPDIEFPDVPFSGEYPDAATAEWIIENNTGKRPIYIGAPVTSLLEKGYQFRAEGLLFRVFEPASNNGSM